MLPTIIMFDNGVAVDRIVGFEELGGADDFPTINLTRRLIRGGVLEAKTKHEKGHINIRKGKNKRNNDESSGDEY